MIIFNALKFDRINKTESNEYNIFTYEKGKFDALILAFTNESESFNITGVFSTKNNQILVQKYNHLSVYFTCNELAYT